MNIKTILTVLFILLLYPLKMPQGEEKDAKIHFWPDYHKPCSQVFRVDTCERYMDSIWMQKYPYSAYETIVCDTAVEYHWEYYIRHKLCTTLVRDTTVYLGE